ncbi:MAG TPA: Gmad2 immunoglobulin-like domain-containing protein [Patescibacteria group bacterium]|nr:Gmad2 immunoglobulin-like domain-containing protein [Patescibacteria group bacterium]
MTHHQHKPQRNDFSLYGWVFLILAVVVLVGVGVYYFSSRVGNPSNSNNASVISSGNTNISNESANENANEATNESAVDTNANASENTNTGGTNENTNAAVTNTPVDSEAVRSNIMIRYPADGSTVGLPLKIQGEGREFESVVAYRVKTAKGIVLAEGSTQTAAPDIGKFGQYLISLPLDITTETSAVIEVFANSPKDGKEIDKVTRNVTIDPGLRALEIYFSNSKASPEAICETTVPAIRSIVKVEKIGTETLQELLKGPTDEEKALGFATNISPETKLQSFTIEGTEGRPDFSADLDKGVAGSCRVQSIASQIKNTLMQFSTLKTVRISIEGRTEGILQP